MKDYDKLPSSKDHSDTDDTDRIRSKRYANTALMSGILAFISLPISFSAAIIIGMSANMFFILSKEEGRPRHGSAVAGLILGTISVIFGVIEFLCMMKIYHMVSDPQYAPFFDQAMQLYDNIVGSLK